MIPDYLVEYQLFVRGLANHSTTEVNGNVLHMVLGVMTEAGELANPVKKRIGYGQSLDVANMIEEIGDCLFYLTGLADVLGYSLQEIMERNQSKLRRRYPQGYSDQAALERKDKQHDRDE